MPPVPRNSDEWVETHKDVDDVAVKPAALPKETLDHVEKSSIDMDEERILPVVFARTLVAGLATGYVLNSFGLFDSYFWISVLLITMVAETSSPAVNALSQFLFPVSLVAYFASLEIYPSYLQLAMFMPTTLLLIGVPMSVCLHRYFSHGAFATSRPMQALIGVLACLAYQGGPLWWAAKHTRHHHHCDQPEDPHSVVQSGFFYAFCGWTINPKNLKERDVKYNNPSLFVPELIFLDRFYLLPVALLFSVIDAIYGRPFIAYSLFLPMLFCRLITLLFNVEYHPAHDVRRCKSVDNPRILALLVGEAEHDIHHKKPNLCKRNNGDIPYWITLFWMEAAGLVWDCR